MEAGCYSAEAQESQVKGQGWEPVWSSTLGGTGLALKSHLPRFLLCTKLVVIFIFHRGES